MEHRDLSAAAGILAGVLRNIPQTGLDVPVSTGVYLGHCIAFPTYIYTFLSIHFICLKPGRAVELQRNLYFEVFPFSPWKTSRINENI